MTDRTRHDNTTSNDPAVIERDIRRTQEDMSRTVDKIGDQLTIKNVFNALLDKADENGVDANYLIDGARRNPMALGLIAAGAIWLVSDKDSKFPSMPHKSKGDGSDGFDFEGHDVHHRDYVAHMSAFEMRDGEDLATYQRRRDVHRANFLMCEQRPQEFFGPDATAADCAGLAPRLEDFQPRNTLDLDRVVENRGRLVRMASRTMRIQSVGTPEPLRS